MDESTKCKKCISSHTTNNEYEHHFSKMCKSNTAFSLTPLKVNQLRLMNKIQFNVITILTCWPQPFLSLADRVCSSGLWSPAGTA